MISLLLLAVAIEYMPLFNTIAALAAVALSLFFRYSDKGKHAVQALQAEMRTHEVAIAQMNVKVETMWQFQFRRAISEGSQAGSLKVNSPVKPSEKLAAMFEPMRADLTKWYQTVAQESDFDAAVKLEFAFGERIMKEVAIPNDLNHGVALIGALSVAKQANGRDSTVRLTPTSTFLAPSEFLTQEESLAKSKVIDAAREAQAKVRDAAREAQAKVRDDAIKAKELLDFQRKSIK
jgi:hypothetical protein